MIAPEERVQRQQILRTARLYCNASQAEFSHALGCCRKTLQDWELGKRLIPKMQVVHALEIAKRTLQARVSEVFNWHTELCPICRLERLGDGSLERLKLGYPY
jgi:DNA-binding XRE family transcriptional regulator